MGNSSNRPTSSHSKRAGSDDALLQANFEALADSSSPIGVRKQALQILRSAYVPDISHSPAYSQELSRVFELRFDPWSGVPFSDDHTAVSSSSMQHNQHLVAAAIRGIIFGTAVGDATGLATEFLTKTQIVSYFGQAFSFSPGCDVYPDIHRVSFTVGDWTDDTDQMILALMTLLECGGSVDVVTFARHLYEWKEHGFSGLGDQGGCGLGKSTKAVIQHEKFLVDPILAARDVWERSGRKLAANGALMRTAITAIPQFWDLEKVKQNTVLLCTCTHSDPRCQASCVFLCVTIAQILQYWSTTHIEQSMALESLIVMLQRSYEYAEPVLISSNTASQQTENGLSQNDLIILCKELHDSCHYSALRHKTFSDLELDDAATMGYTYKCLSAAVVALLTVAEKSLSFEQAINEIVRQGGDADTNAAVAGALLGVYLGVHSISSSWMSAMPYEMWLEAWAQKVLFMLQLPISNTIK